MFTYVASILQDRNERSQYWAFSCFCNQLAGSLCSCSPYLCCRLGGVQQGAGSTLWGYEALAIDNVKICWKHPHIHAGCGCSCGSATAAPILLFLFWVCRLGCSHIRGTPAAIPVLLSGTVAFVAAEVCELLNAVYVGGMLNSFLPSITIKASPKPFRVNVKSWCLLDLDPFCKNEWHLPRGKTNKNRKGDHICLPLFL